MSLSNVVSGSDSDVVNIHVCKVTLCHWTRWWFLNVYFLLVKESIRDLQKQVRNVEDKLSAAENKELLALRQANDKLTSHLEVCLWCHLCILLPCCCCWSIGHWPLLSIQFYLLLSISSLSICTCCTHFFPQYKPCAGWLQFQMLYESLAIFDKYLTISWTQWKSRVASCLKISCLSNLKT